MKASQLTTDYEFIKRCIKHPDNIGEHYESLNKLISLFYKKHIYNKLHNDVEYGLMLEKRLRKILKEKFKK